MGTTRREAWADRALSFRGDEVTRRGRLLSVPVVLYALAINAVLIQTIVIDENSPLKTIVRVAVLVVAVMTTALRGARIPSWIFYSVAISVILLVVRGNPDQLTVAFVLILAPLLCLASDRVVLKAAMRASWAALALIFVFLFSGLTQNTLEVSSIMGYAPRERWTYGTASVPFFFNVVYATASLTVLYAWKYGSARLRAVALIIGLAGSTYFFVQTDVRGGYISLCIFMVLLWLVPATARSAIVRGAVALLPVWFLAVALGTAGLSEHVGLNAWLSTRPRLFRDFLSNITLQDLVLSTSVKRFDDRISTVSVVDNSFLHLMVGAGLWFLIVFVVVTVVAVRRLYANRCYPDIAFLVATLAYCNTESILFRAENIAIVYLWYLLVRSSSPAESGRRHETSTESAVEGR